MTNKVTVTVTGGSATGKTTIADLLYEFLSEQGFVTAQVEFEPLDEVRRAKYKETRIQTIKDNTVIIINEKQAKRSCL